MGRPKGLPKYGGRAKGTPNKKTVKLQAEIAATGKTPMQVMLDHMREADEECETLKRAIDKLNNSARIPEAEELRADGITKLYALLQKTRAYALECATAAANYVHPRLQSIVQRNLDASGKPVGPTINIYGATGKRIAAPTEEE